MHACNTLTSSLMLLYSLFNLLISHVCLGRCVTFVYSEMQKLRSGLAGDVGRVRPPTRSQQESWKLHPHFNKDRLQTSSASNLMACGWFQPGVQDLFSYIYQQMSFASESSLVFNHYRNSSGFDGLTEIQSRCRWRAVKLARKGWAIFPK